MATSTIDILIVGATGNLGSLITRECLKRPNLRVNTLVFEKNEDKCLCEEVAKAGGKCFMGDITRPETFRSITKGMHTVICSVLGNEEVFSKGQMNLLNDCIENGVKRFIPSSFTIDIWNLKQGENRWVDYNLELRRKIESSNIKGLFCANGMFMETYVWFAKRCGFIYYGDINQKLNLTCERNVAEVLSFAISNPERIGDLRICGDELSTREICDLYNLTFNEKNEPKCLGSLDDLKNKGCCEKSEKSSQDFSLNLLCGFLLPVFDGRARMKMNNNNEFPEVKFERMEDFLKCVQSKGFKYEFPTSDLANKFEQLCGGKC